MNNMNPFYGQPYSFMQPSPSQVQSDGSLMAVLVQGEAGANAYPVASGNTVLLVDFPAGKFWVKSNQNGIPQRLRSFSFTEDQPQELQSENVTRDEFNQLSQNVSGLANSVNKLIAELGGTNNEQ